MIAQPIAQPVAQTMDPPADPPTQQPVAQSAPHAVAPLEVRRFTIAEYHHMIQAGVFHEDERLELLDGEIVPMSPIGSRHAACVNRLVHLLVQAVASRAIVSAQNPIRLNPYSEPEPDVALLRPSDDFYAAETPGSQDALLVIEVADSSLEHDRTNKIPLYARAGIGEVWLVDLDGRVVDVYRNPSAEGYLLRQRYLLDHEIVMDALGITVPVTQILGGATP